MTSRFAMLWCVFGLTTAATAQNVLITEFMAANSTTLLDEDGDFAQRCNLQMVDLEALEDVGEEQFVRDLIARHAELTGSTRAQAILEDWKQYREKLIKVMPLEYRRVLAEQKQQNLNALTMVQHG